MKKIIFAIGTLGILLSPIELLAEAPQGAFQQGINNAKTVATREGLYTKTTLDIIENVILFLMAGNAVLALAAFIWASVLYVTAWANEDHIEKAKKTILYAIIGLLMMSVSFIIIRIIKDVILKNP